MDLDIPRDEPRQDGDYHVTVTKGYGDPRGAISLDENWKLILKNVRVADCDRLIKAAAEIKERMLAYLAEITVPHGRDHLYKGECQLCGKPEDDELHEPAAAVILDVAAPAVSDGLCTAVTGPDEELDVTLYCDREAGHPGRWHHAPGPDEGSEVAWSDAPASVTA